MNFDRTPPTEVPVASPPARPFFRFSLLELLVLTALVCVLAGLYSWRIAAPDLAVVLVATMALILLLYTVYLVTRCSPATLILVFAILFVSFLLLLPPMGDARGAFRRMQCQNHLKQIAIALHNYQDTYGSFPPPFIADSAGKPMHSWRVLLLPFLGQQALYDRYDFSEPWDGPNNSQLHDIQMKVYTCPCEATPTTDTSYVAVVGRRTMWSAENRIRFSDVTDGVSNTLLVVELHSSGVHWMEPRDLHMTQMAPAINAPRGQGISSLHRGGAQAAMADSSVRFLPDGLKPEGLRGLLTRNGKESITDHEYEVANFGKTP